MEVENRKGLLAAVSTKIADINTNIKNIEARTDEDQRARIDMTVEITDVKHLEKVIKSLSGVAGVIGVERAGRGPGGAGRPNRPSITRDHVDLDARVLREARHLHRRARGRRLRRNTCRRPR